MLDILHLRKSFATPEGVVPVIDDVSFSITAGTCYALLGPSGCGKTTTLRCVAGLEQADAGTITLAGTVVSDPARGIQVPVYQRSIGMVFQSYAIWPHFDVFENVAYPLRVQRPALPRAQIATRVTDALALVGMQALAQRPASRLSGGQQQRVALARALVRRPKLLLLDEPLSNLDARLRDSMRYELAQMIARAGVTALFVTHDQTEAFALADQIAVMERGHLIQAGAPREIYQRPRTPFVATFLGAANVVHGRVTAESAAPGYRLIVLNTPSGTQRLQAMVEHAPGQDVALVIRPEDICLSRAPVSGPALQGRVTYVSFLGAVVEYGIDVDGILLKAVSHGTAQIVQDQTVWLRVARDRCVAF